MTRRFAAILACSALIASTSATAALRREPVRREGSRAGQPVGPPANRGPVRPEIPVIPSLRAMPAPTCSAFTTDGELMMAELHSPMPGTVLAAYVTPCPPVLVSGTGSVGRPLADLYFILDSSGSTSTCSGFDVDQDGILGVPPPFGRECTDPGDTVLAAEVRAVRDFVALLNPATTRVAIIQFSAPEGTLGGLERQRIVQSLTSDFLLVNGALDEIMFYGSSGATDYGGALDLARAELLANGQPATRRQRAYMLSDGIPTYPVFPFSSEEPGDSQLALDAADRVALLGLEVDTYGVGFIPTVTLDPNVPRRCIKMTPSGPIETSTLECIALRTGGAFFASTDPEEILDRLLQSRPAGIESVTVTNLTNGVTVTLTPSPDGSFATILPVDEGRVNDIDVTVRAEDGTTCTMQTNVLTLCFAAGCSPLTQGYWHRQCMGLGLIPPDGPGPPPHPDWEPEILLRIMAALTDPVIQALGSPIDQTTCQALDAEPPDDPCQRAIKQFAAVLLNMSGGRLGPTCALELPDLGFVSPDEAVTAIEALIVRGLAGDLAACRQAADLADLINTGAAVR